MDEQFFEEESSFSFLSQPISADYNFAFSFNSMLDWQNQIFPEDNFVSEAIPWSISYFDFPYLESICCSPQDLSNACNYGSPNETRDPLESNPKELSMSHEQCKVDQSLEKSEQNTTKETTKKRKPSKRNVEDGEARIRDSTQSYSASKALPKETISQHFYLPITEAARELNVGVTFLKKRCRELGIRRWPHRKLKSLENVIAKLKEMENETNLRNVVEILEEEKKKMEEFPNLEYEERTKRLRQSCFKADFKRKRFMTTATDR